MGAHRPKRSETGFDRSEIAVEILRLLDPLCLELGKLLEAAHHGSIDEWSDWVASSTPFTVEEARRLRAVAIAYRVFPQEVVDKLPHPWQALWTVPAGRIGRGMPRSAVSAKRVNGAELFATRLLASDPNDVSMDVVSALAEWLHGRDNGTVSSGTS